MAAFILVTKSSNQVVLKRVFYIYHLILFKMNEIKILIVLGSKFNTITLVYAAKLDLKLFKTNNKVEKIDGFTFVIFCIVLANF